VDVEFMRLFGLAQKLAFGALALWLAVWPVGDAITGASRTLILLPPAAAEPAACSEMDPSPAPGCAGEARCGQSRGAERVVKACGDSHSACGAGAATGAESKPACPSSKAARCSQCQSIGGVVLFATAPPRHLPNLELVGTLSAIRIVRPSRSLQPPVRPPIAELLSAI
jgi:hypothetical protein